MCGRYSLGKKPRNWPEETQPFIPRFNIAPTQQAPVFVSNSALKIMRWGLVPSWAEDETTGYKMINARAETIAERPAFRSCLQSRRCAIPADSFFEWRKNGKPKQPFRFLRADQEPFLFAGLWDRWRKQDGSFLHSFTIITVEPNELVRPLHDRMPAILNSEGAAAWLAQGNLNRDWLSQFLSPFPAKEMTSYAIDTRINDANWDDPDCIKPFIEPTSMLPGL